MYGTEEDTHNAQRMRLCQQGKVIFIENSRAKKHSDGLSLPLRILESSFLVGGSYDVFKTLLRHD